MAEILRISGEAPEPHLIEYAADMIRRGRVIAVPTDTFYGLAADPYNLAAVAEIYRIKGRVEQKALPILVSSVEQAEEMAADLPGSFYMLTQRFWPGALTLVVDASRRLPLKVTGNTGRVALRQPAAKIPCALISAAQTPITGTSANLSGFPACSNAAQVAKQMGDDLPLIVEGGESKATLASTVVDLRGDGWQILREGGISEEEIRAALASE